MLEKTAFNAPDGQPYQLIQLTNSNGMTVQFMDWGATWISCKVPVNGELREVLLGCKVEDYPHQTAYLGASVGRYANRIANAKFELGEQTIQLVANQGNVQVNVIYTLTDENSVKIEYEAESDKDTALNLTNHAYFNLENAEQGSDVRNHTLCLNADFYLPVDGEGIPNSPLKHVVNTSFDFRVAKPIAQDFQQGDQVLTSPNEDLSLEVLTSQAALQVYTGNYLAGTPTREGSTYQDFSGIALETQCLPDTPNHPEWQNYGGIQKAGERYYQWTEFKFK